MTDDAHNSIQDEVLAKIRRGDIRMRPRAYFLLRAGATAAVALLALVLSVFVLSFILFSVHESGEQFLLGFGAHGIAVFFQLFPWLLFFVDIVLIFTLEWLLQGFAIGYHRSLLTIFTAIIALAGILGFLITLTPLHRAFLERADRGELPLIGEFYEGIHDSHENRGIFRGTITALSQNGFDLNCNDTDQDKDEGTFHVNAPSGAPEGQPFFVGERVYVFGTTTRPGIIDAYGIKKLTP